MFGVAGALNHGHRVHDPSTSSWNSPGWQSEQDVSQGSLERPLGHLRHPSFLWTPEAVE